MIIQNAPNGWSQWFYTNAPAAWFSALAALITLAFVLRSRKKPNRIVVREVTNSSLVRVWPSIREKIVITFLGRLIQNVGQLDFEIFNEGSEVIKLPKIELSLQGGSNILDILLTPADPRAQTEVKENKVVLTVPHLNPYREHKQILKLSILLDGRSERITVSGNGEGWSTRHISLPDGKLSTRKMVLLLLLMVASVTFLALDNFLISRLGLGNSVFVHLAFLIPAIAVFIYGLIQVSRTASRLLF